MAGESLSETVKGFIYAAIGILIATALVPTVADQVSQASDNVSGAAAAILPLITLVFVFGIVGYSIRTFFK